MPEPRLRIAEADWGRVRKHCSPSFRGKRDTEYGMIGLLSKRSAAVRGEEFLVSKLLIPREGDVIAGPHTEITFTATYLRRAQLEARREGLAGIITFHTHPLAGREVRFSGYDDEQDPLLVENLQDIWPPTLLASVVFGESSQQGRVWKSPTEVVPLSTLVAVGERLTYLQLDGKALSPPPLPAELFDRALAMTGEGALARLSRMTIVVVGASGTGSIVCELLARAGCKRIIVVDHDIVKLANLNRILYATAYDAKYKRRKVTVLQRGIERLGLGCEVIPIAGSILGEAVLDQIAGADLIFGCVDRDFPRMMLCQYAYRHLIPYIDVGAEIGANKEGIVSTDARLSYVAPGRPCLRCTGLVTGRRLHFESLARSERSRFAALGYSDDLLIAQPAVMDLNMRAASTGVMVLRHLLQPFLLEPIPVTLAENLVTYRMRAMESIRADDPSCDVCRSNAKAGFGDCAPPLGMPSKLAAEFMDV